MTTLTRFFLRPAAWTSYASECAAKIPHDNPIGHIWNLAKSVQAGECELLEISKEGHASGIVIFQIEQHAGREFVVVAAFAENSGHDLTALLLPELEKFARARDCISVRFHTIRPGLVFKSVDQGYRVSEVILRKNVIQ